MLRCSLLYPFTGDAAYRGISEPSAPHEAPARLPATRHIRTFPDLQRRTKLHEAAAQAAHAVLKIRTFAAEQKPFFIQLLLYAHIGIQICDIYIKLCQIRLLILLAQQTLSADAKRSFHLSVPRSVRQSTAES